MSIEKLVIAAIIAIGVSAALASGKLDQQPVQVDADPANSVQMQIFVPDPLNQLFRM